MNFFEVISIQEAGAGYKGITLKPSYGSKELDEKLERLAKEALDKGGFYGAYL